MQQFPALWCIAQGSPFQDTVNALIRSLPGWGFGPPGGREVLVWDGQVEVDTELRSDPAWELSSKRGVHSEQARLILLGPGPVLYPFPVPVSLHLAAPTAAELWIAVLAVSQRYTSTNSDFERSLSGYRFQSEQESGPALTPREREVLELIAQGLPNKAVAHELGIGLGTVKFHLARLMGKLGAQNRAEAVMEAAREGLLKV